MSTPQLPNLLDSLGTGRGRGRRRGRGRGGLGENHDDNQEKKDRIVQKTDEDASVSRMSAVEMGYLDDPFARAFVYDPPTPRRYPIINRGTYVRTAAIDTLVNKFLAADPGAQKQIISLGAGSDTRYFRIISKDPTVKLVYHELDFPTNVAQKISAIQHTPSLLAVIRSTLSTPSDLQITAHTLTSPTYNIHPLDLRTLAIDPSTSASPPLPTLPHLSTAAPTLLLSECCLIYLSPHDADSILATLTTSLIPPSTPLALVLYEPIRPHDPFGRVMISNLAARGIHLQTLQKYSSLSRQRARLRSAGFVDGQAAADVDFIWGRWVGEAEKERVAGLEMLDELEEWVLLARHYCVAWGWRDEVGEGGGLFGTAWEGVVGQEGNDEEEGID